MMNKSQLKELFLNHRFAPLKRFGENYLIDNNIRDKILREAAIKRNDTVLEIGPGLGALTIDLAKTGAAIAAVEKDRKAFDILKDIVAEDYPNLKLINSDILDFDIGKAAPEGGLKVIGNLPYYITTPVIELLISNRFLISSALIVIQKEVARRLLARPGSKDYSSLSCFVQYFTQPQYIHTISRTSFFPKPEVDSSLVKLSMLKAPRAAVKDEELFFRIVRGSFNQRRKSLVNSLSRKEVLDRPKAEVTGILEGIGIDPSARPEDISIESFAKITNAFTA